MSFLDSLKSFSEYLMEGERDNDLDFDDVPTRTPVQSYPRTNIARSSGGASSSVSGGAARSKIVDMQVSTNVKMATYRPTSFNSNGECREIAEALREKRCVILNLEDIDKKEQRRLLDFLSGFSYAQMGVVQKISMDVYFFGPYNVDFIGEDSLMSFLEDSNPW